MAFWIILPLAWTFGYFPILGPILLAVKTRGVMRTLDTIGARVRSGANPTAEQKKEMEDYLTTLAAQENGIPEFLARKLIRKLLPRLIKHDGAKKDGPASGGA